MVEPKIIGSGGV